jgi:KDO2-lipid IV(A) lauroyltransferase
MPIENKIFNRLFQRIRGRFGTSLVAATNFRNEFLPHSKGRYAMALVGDQNPANPGGAYWVEFFGRKTPFLKGAERNARMNDDAVMFVNFYRTKRGYYHCDVVLLTTEPRKLPAGEITKQLIAFIEDAIRRHPANYLWSHRRWKWEFDEEKYGKLVIS